GNGEGAARFLRFDAPSRKGSIPASKRVKKPLVWLLPNTRSSHPETLIKGSHVVRFPPSGNYAPGGIAWLRKSSSKRNKRAERKPGAPKTSGSRRSGSTSTRRPRFQARPSVRGSP